MHWRRRSKRRLAVLLAGVLVCVVGVGALRAVRDMQQQRLVAEARQAGFAAMAAGDLNAALSHFSYYFEREKTDLEVNLAFAQARAQLPIAGGRHLLEAIDLYSTHGLRLLERQPHLDRDGSRKRLMLERLLDLYCQGGLRHEIIQTADALLAIDPHHSSALSAKAEALCLNGEFAQAMPLLEKLITLDPDDLRWRRLFLVAMSETGASSQQRIEQCEAWADTYAKDGRFHVLAASLLLDQDRLSESRERLLLAASKGAADAHVLERACDLMDGFDMREQADAVIKSTIETQGNESWPHEVHLRRLWRANRLEDAVAAMREAQQSVDHPSPRLRRVMTLICLAANTPDQAQALLAALRSHQEGGESTEADRTWAEAILAAMDPDRHSLTERIALLEQAIAANADDAPLHVLAGDAWTQARESAHAIAHYQRGFELDPAWQTAGLLYGEALLAAGRIEEAYAIAHTILTRMHQPTPRPLLLFASAYVAMRAAGRLDHQAMRIADLEGDVRAIIAHLRQENPSSAQVAWLYAEAVMQFDGPTALQAMADELARDEQMTAQAILAVADVFLAHGLPAPAVLLDRAAQDASLRFEVALRAAASQAQAGDPVAAWNALDRAVDEGQDLTAEQAIALLQFMIQHGAPGVVDAMAALIAQFPNSIEAQQLALSYPAATADRDLTARALENLKRLVGPESPQVQLAAASLMLRDHGLDQATRARAVLQIEEVLRQAPDSLAALTLLAEALSRGPNQNLDRAAECLERAANLYTTQPALLVRLIEVLQRNAEYDRAGRYLRLLARMPDAPHAIRKSEVRLWHNQGDFETALARASVIVTDASPATDQLLLASIHHRAGRHDEARAIYQRLLAEPSPPPFVLAQAADFFASTGDVQRGLELISKIQPSDPCATADLIIGDFLLRHGELAAAGEHLQQAVRDIPYCAAAHALLARYCLATQDRAAARRHALNGLRIEPANPALATVFAIASFGMAQPERREALQTLGELDGQHQELIDTLALLDDVPTTRGVPQPTDLNLQSARKLVELHPRFMPAWHLAITLHTQAGHVNEAIALARRAVGRFPADAEPAQWSTELLMRAGQWQAALADAYEWERRSPTPTTILHVTLATILLELNRAHDALDYLNPLNQSLVENRAQSPEQLALYLRALVRAGQVDRAATLIEPLLEEDSRWRSHWLALALDAEEQYAPSMLTLLDRDSASDDERLQLAGAWIEIGRAGCQSCLDRAQALAARLAESDDRRIAVGALLIRGGVAEARHQWTDAERSCRQALAIDPSHPVALNNLAFALAHLPDRLDEALHCVQRALQLQPDHPDFLDTHSMILLRRGLVDEAERVARRAAQLRPDDLRIALSLAEARLRQPSASDRDDVLRDLQQRMQLQRRLDPDLVKRFEALREKWEQSQIETGT